MSDYLRHLAAHALDAPPGLRVRVPAMFEPLPGPASLLGEFVAPGEIEAPEPVAPSRRAALPPREAAESEPIALAEPGRRPAHPRTPATQRAIEPSLREAAAQGGETAPALVANPPALAAQSAEPRAVKRAAELPADRSAFEQADERAQPAIPQSKSEATLATRSQPRRTVTQAVPVTPVAPVPAPQPTAVVRSAAPHSGVRSPAAPEIDPRRFTAASTRLPRLPARSAPEPAPTITISIGRIEVRAQPAAATTGATAKSRQASVMTLDAYMRRRQQGDL
jgi:hypothetical protein